MDINSATWSSTDRIYMSLIIVSIVSSQLDSNIWRARQVTRSRWIGTLKSGGRRYIKDELNFSNKAGELTQRFGRLYYCSMLQIIISLFAV